MTVKVISEVLIKAKALIADPSHWTFGANARSKNKRRMNHPVLIKFGIFALILFGVVVPWLFHEIKKEKASLECPAGMFLTLDRGSNWICVIVPKVKDKTP